MIPIKLRAWDKQDEAMVTSDDNEARFTITSNGIEVEYAVEQFYEGGGEIYSRINYEVLDADVTLFTGLKDKHGKEVYGGDVVSFGGKHSYTVEFVGYAFYLFHTKLKEFDETPLRWGLLSRVAELGFALEIIGNIYENPELLK